MSYSPLTQSLTNYLTQTIVQSKWFKKHFGPKIDQSVINLAGQNNRKEFPKYFIWLYYLAVIGGMLGAFAIGLFVIPVNLEWLQQIIYHANDHLIILAPSTALIAIIPSMFMALLIYFFILQLVAYYLWPDLAAFFALQSYLAGEGRNIDKEELKKITEQALARIDFYKVSKHEWQKFFKLALPMVTVLLVINLLAMDTYRRINSEGFSHNGFWQIGEKKDFAWSEVKALYLSFNAELDDEGDELVFKPLLVVKQKNNSTDLVLWKNMCWGAPSVPQIKQILALSQEKNIPVYFKHGEPEDLEDALDRYSKSEIDALRDLVKYVSVLKTLKTDNFSP